LTRWIRAIVALGAAACASGSPGSTGSPRTLDDTLTFTFDAPAGGEQYECFGFDASALAGRWLTGIEWKAPPPGGGAELHHAALYAFPQDYPDGPVACDTMPVAWTMHLWLPGGGPLTLPPGVALTLPPGTRRFVIQAHVLRAAAGPAGTASATLHSTSEGPAHDAKWLPAEGSVPAIRPHMTEHTSTTCTAAAPMHVVSSAPHMHLLGTSFQGAFVQPGGTRSVFIDVPAWNFDEQKTYAVDKDVAAGELVETDCTWVNTTDAYVLPGTSTHDEMCGQALIVWPARTAAWASSCQ
jgi:hypothetical protein